MNLKVLRAVFRRNLVSYFANPTGYVFICVFVLLSTIAAFWPTEFFNTNLANLDQLSFSPANPLRSFPFIMLVFIPAITMSIWADERRQGTDELLLTIPASDLDIVLGKYLAAVAIYTVSLVFSLFCNYVILLFLSTPGPGPDMGLFLGTYFGYWLVGLAMLAIGMVASFLTPNLTIAYILGAALNAPLVFAVFAENVTSGTAAMAIRQWSIADQFRDFGRGIVSLSGLLYFGMVVAVMLYLSIVLIGRRHWREARGRLPNNVFYGLLHVAWLLSFASFWIVLRDRFDATNTFIWLASIYLVLQTALLWGWSKFPRRAEAGAMDAVVALIHLAVIIGFVVLAPVLTYYTDSRGVLVAAFVLYLVIHAGLVFGWFRLAGSAALLPGQYTVRALALVMIGVGSLFFLRACPRVNVRVDVTSERLSSLSPYTRDLMKKLQEIDRPVKIEAFVSPAVSASDGTPTVPDAYVQPRLELLSRLDEIKAYGGEKVTLTVHSTEQLSDEAALAEDRYGITVRNVPVMEQGTLSQKPLFMGIAFTCGVEKVVVPFIDRGIPVEYELVRSVATVTQQKRRKVGVLDTDAQLYGQLNMQTMSSSGNWPIIGELEKQYEVERVDATNPISDEYDVLLAVQPSSLGPEQMNNLVAAIRSGIPTAIFEDPMPFWHGHVPGTNEPRRPPGGMNPFMGGRQPQMPKGDVSQLWSLLKIDFGANRIIWQDYNPLPRYADLYKEYVFVDHGSDADEPFNESDPVTSGLQQVLFPFPGSIRNLNVSDLDFTPLVRTGTQTGTVNTADVFEFAFMGQRRLNRSRPRIQTSLPYILAAHITGKAPADPLAGDDGGGNGDGNGDEHGGGNGNGNGDEHGGGNGNGNGEEEATPEGPDSAESPAEAPKPKQRPINVVLVADIDLLHGEFFHMRERGAMPELGVYLDFDNVTFTLNVLDMLAGDDRFVEIRKRRPKHRTLTRIDKSTEEARKDTETTIQELRETIEKTRDETEQALRDEVKRIEDDMKKAGGLSLIEVANRIEMVQRDREKKNQAKLERLERDTKRKIDRIERQLRAEKRRFQNKYKMWAVFLPPIPPLAVALIVFFTRRAREREGVARSRLRS